MIIAEASRGVVLTGFLLLLSCPLAAATIAGTVSDEGEPLSGVTVTLIDADNGVIIATRHTGTSGAYRFEVQAKRYKLRASKADYADAWIKDIAVMGALLRQDISMTPQVFVDDTRVSPSDDCD